MRVVTGFMVLFVLLPGPLRRMPEPAATLQAAGFEVHSVALYRTEPLEPSTLPAAPFHRDDFVFFASPSAVRAFVAAYPDQKPPCAAIGESTADAARRHGLDPVVAASPSLSGLCRAAGLELDGDQSRERGSHV